MSKDIYLTQEETLVFITTYLKNAGVSNEILEPVAKGLVWTSMRGIDSHGIRLLPHYLKAVKNGRINIKPDMKFIQTAPSTGLLDADDTFGHTAGMEAMKYAVELANESGIGAVSVYNSSHCGALSYFAHEAAKNNMIGFAFTHATARIKSPGSSRPFFGNNPMCMVAPMLNEEPFCYDAATSAITFNAVKAAAAEGNELDYGLVADINGEVTTDPSKAEQLLPIGDYKGFGLSMVVDILCALLSGMPSGNNVSQMFGDSMDKKRKLGHFFCALRIDAFKDITSFKSELKELADRVRNEPTIDSLKKVMVPGDPEKKRYKDNLKMGIKMPKELKDFINKEKGYA